MALLFVDSYDHYATADIPRKYSETSGDVSIVSLGRCSSNCLQVGNGSTAGTASKGVNPTNRAEAIVGFAVKFPVATPSNPLFFSLMAGSSPLMAFARTTTGGLTYSINAEAAFPTYTPLTAGDIFRVGQWYFLELKVVISTGSSGSIAVRINGEDRTLAGFDSGVTTGFYASYWDGIRFQTGTFGRSYYVEDLYISDTSGSAPWNDFLGDVKVEYLEPTGAGNYQDWTLGAGASHYAAVDDGSAPDDDTSYITADAVDTIDTEVYEDSALPSGADVFGVQMVFLALKDDPGDRAIAAVTRQAATDYVSADNLYPSDETYDFRHSIFQDNPATSAQWTITEVNNAEFGVKVTI